MKISFDKILKWSQHKIDFWLNIPESIKSSCAFISWTTLTFTIGVVIVFALAFAIIFTVVTLIHLKLLIPSILLILVLLAICLFKEIKSP